MKWLLLICLYLEDTAIWKLVVTKIGSNQERALLGFGIWYYNSSNEKSETNNRVLIITVIYFNITNAATYYYNYY